MDLSENFAKCGIREGDLIMLTPNDKSKILRWYRFTGHLYDSNQILFKEKWDAITFIPKVDITFMGF